jgi:hypothetical protein
VRLLLGPYLAVGLLLGAAGALKVRRPDTTARAMREVGLPASALAVRIGGGVEVVVAIGSVAIRGWLFPVLVGVSYTAFTLFVLLAMQQGRPLSSCGCFGGRDTPPSGVHVAVDAAAAAVAFAWASQAHPDVTRLWSDQPLGGVPLVLLAIGISALAYLVLTDLPRTRTMADR